jgi:AcrR family transcriptional regulator
MSDASSFPPPTDHLPEDVIRRVPVQARSRERVERILSVAAELLEADGSDRLRMTEVAERAGVSVGSLYQYFPDKSAVLRTLAERYNDQGRGCIRDELEGIESEAKLPDALARLVEGYYRMFLENPAMLAIWSAAQADPALEEVQLEHVRACGALIEEALARARTGPGEVDLRNRAMLLAHLIDATVRLAVTLGRKDGDRVVEIFRQALSEGFLSHG